MPRKKPLKAPFVVTISVAAVATMAVACGGKTSGVSSSSGDVGPDINPPLPYDYCNPDRTRSGDPCVNTGSSCKVSDAYSGVQILQCVGGQWTTTVNPPPPPEQCPFTEPRGADYCYGWGSQCSYLDRCAERPEGYPTYRVYECANGSWKRQLPYVATCPQAMPKGGDSCASCSDDYPVECKYLDGSGCPPVIARCDQKTLTWQVAISTCNPPPPDAGAGP